MRCLHAIALKYLHFRIYNVWWAGIDDGVFGVMQQVPLLQHPSSSILLWRRHLEGLLIRTSGLRTERVTGVWTMSLSLHKDELPALHYSPEVVTFHQLRVRGHDMSVVYIDSCGCYSVSPCRSKMAGTPTHSNFRNAPFSITVPSLATTTISFGDKMQGATVYCSHHL
jgi:hypothetical protein